MSKNYYTTRLCALCDKIIPDTYITCKEHWAEYQKYKDEEWFKLLVSSQRRQFEIDNEEIALELGIIPKTTKPYNKLTESQKYSILFLRSKKLGYRSISKVLDIPVSTICMFLKRSAYKQ